MAVAAASSHIVTRTTYVWCCVRSIPSIDGLSRFGSSLGESILQNEIFFVSRRCAEIVCAWMHPGPFVLEVCASARKLGAVSRKVSREYQQHPFVESDRAQHA